MTLTSLPGLHLHMDELFPNKFCNILSAKFLSLTWKAYFFKNTNNKNIYSHTHFFKVVGNLAIYMGALLYFSWRVGTFLILPSRKSRTNFLHSAHYTVHYCFSMFSTFSVKTKKKHRSIYPISLPYTIVLYT